MSPQKRRGYEGPMSEPQRHLQAEDIFPVAPFDQEFYRRLKREKNWSGLMVSYRTALTPLSLTENDVFVDMGCGMGEHAVTAALGHPSGIGPVKHALGLSASIQEIERARLLARYAAKNREDFFELLERTDWSINRNLYEFLPKLSPDMLEMPPTNLYFQQTNLFHTYLPDDFASKTLSSSVAPYISTHQKRRSMLEEVLRITRSGGLVNVYSESYAGQDGMETDAARELSDVALSLGVRLKPRRERVPENSNFSNQMIYEMVK